MVDQPLLQWIRLPWSDPFDACAHISTNTYHVTAIELPFVFGTIDSTLLLIVAAILYRVLTRTDRFEPGCVPAA